jgi:hypothetical protein
MQSLCGLRAAQVAALLEWLKTNAARPPANMQTQTLKDWLSAGASPPSASSPVRADIIRQVVETRLEFANNSGTKLNTILAWAMPDGRVRAPTRCTVAIRAAGPATAHRCRIFLSGAGPAISISTRRSPACCSQEGQSPPL